MRLTEAYMALGITNEAQTAAAVLGHNFPDSPWYKDAYVLLESGGLQPRENRGSYISRAFQGFQRAVVGVVGFRRPPPDRSPEGRPRMPLLLSLR